MPKRIILDPAGPKGRPQALRQRHSKQIGFVETAPSRRLGDGAAVTARKAKPSDAGAEGSLIAMVTFEQLEKAQEMAHFTCGQCFEPKHDGACWQD